jgi:hypothetical protein
VRPARPRDLARQRPNEPIDWNLLAEEIERMAGIVGDL